MSQEGEPAPEPDSSTFRTTLVRVLGVEVVTLMLLWLLQVHYSG